MDPVVISIGLALFKGAFSLMSMIQRKRLLKELRKKGDVGDKDFRKLILTEMDNCSVKLDKQSRKVLKTSLSFYKEGLSCLNEVLNEASTGKKGTDITTTKRPEHAGRAALYADDSRTPTAEDLKALNQADLGELANQTLCHAKEAFHKASVEATSAFNDGNLHVSERIDAMNIRLMGKILQNMECPASTLPSCKSYLDELHQLPKIKSIFRDVQGKKSSLSKEEDIKIFLGVCNLHRIIYDHVTRLDPLQRGHWTLPCIRIAEGETIHLIDPLRDARVADALCKLPVEWKENLLVNAADLSVAWSFGTEDGKLISPQDVSVNTNGQFLVADDGDRMIKVFHESGAFLCTFHPLPRILADEDVLSVLTDRDQNLLVLIRLDKYHHSMYTISSNATFTFPLREGFVRCSPIVDQNGEILVLIEEKESKCSVVEVYNTDGRFRRLYGHDILKEPKDMAFDDKHRLMVLNGDNRVVIFNELGEHLDHESFEVVPSEAIAFNSVSKQVIVSSLKKSGLGRHVKISMYDEKRDCVRCIHQGEERSEREQRESVPPKMAVTKDGRIAILAGTIGNSKVVVV